jgi:cytochrome c biogenesis protein CcdA
MSLLITTSLIVSFIAGLAALFAPCCITVLLPSYLGSIFREKRQVILMTLVFFFGILTVFLPLGLGVSVLAVIFREYHNFIFTIGGLFLTGLGLSILLQKKFSLPFHVNPTLKEHNAASVYVLGIFSGIATTCCAPVLAGALALAALPGSIFWGGLYTVMYVLGMVSPLFLIAVFLDKVDFTKRLMRVRKPWEYSFFGRKVSITISDLVAGVMFLGMGLLIIYLAFMKDLTVNSDYQIRLNLYFAQLTAVVNEFLKNIFSPR